MRNLVTKYGTYKVSYLYILWNSSSYGEKITERTVIF